MKSTSRRLPLFVIATCLFVLSGCQALPAVLNPVPAQPNIILIITDDQRYDQMEFMPLTQERIFDEGVAFDRAYVTTPQCCPSRSSILTGLYAHNHGVTNNSLIPDATTFVEVLHENGYYTGIVGKYLNSYPEELGHLPLPEFDVWVTFISGPSNIDYNDPTLNVNGEWYTFEGYLTYILRDFALTFIEQASAQDKPFMLILAPYTPHSPAFPAPGDEERYPLVPETWEPSFYEEDLSDKSPWIQQRPPLEQEEIDEIALILNRQANSLYSLDLAIDSILTDLEQRRILDDTVVIFLSDNGAMAGDHGISIVKLLPYEPASHVPFAIRYPHLVPTPYVDNRLVANIDIAPTIYDLAGVTDYPESDGRSLVPILTGEADEDEWREGIMLEAWPGENRAPDYTAFHTGRYVYIEYEGDGSEFYDLSTDPYQLESQIGNPEYEDEIEELKGLLEKERER